MKRKVLNKYDPNNCISIDNKDYSNLKIEEYSCKEDPESYTGYSSSLGYTDFNILNTPGNNQNVKVICNPPKEEIEKNKNLKGYEYGNSTCFLSNLPMKK